MAKKIHGKQLLDNTIIKTVNGVTYSHQGLTSSNDSNITLNIVSGQTHSFNLGWTGVLPLNRGGLSNSTFTASQILIVNSATSSIVSSGYIFNDVGTSSTDIWTANKIISYISNSASSKGQIGFNINGGGGVITTGVKTYFNSPYSGIITEWEILSTATGSITIDVWKDTFVNYPPNAVDTICGGNKPLLSNQIKATGSVSGWNTTVTEGDVFAFNVESVSGVTNINFVLKINKL